MKKVDTDKSVTEDELRPEYDLKNLQVRRFGPERQNFGGVTIRLDSDVAEVFSDSESVNEALRFLIKITKENKIIRLIPNV